MTPESPKSQEKPPLDISGEFAAIWHDEEGDKSIRMAELLRKVSRTSTPVVNFETDYPGLDKAKWLKGLKDSHEMTRIAPWHISIRANTSQMKEAANIFASGIGWVDSEASVKESPEQNRF